MFANLIALTSLNLSNFDTSKVLYMHYMFCNCSLLTSLDLSNFDTPILQSTHYMFYGCKSLSSLDISSFNTTKVGYMEFMFYNCKSLNQLYLWNTDTQRVQNMKYMFYGCSSLSSLDLSYFDPKNAADMQYMFYGCSSLSSLNLSNFNTYKVENMQYMFYNCSSLSSLDLSSFNTERVQRMIGMFSDCSLLSSLDLSNFNTKNTGEMQYMFSNCSSLSSINLSGFDTSKCFNTGYMFFRCESLSSLDITNFNVENVDYMHYMFSNCTSLKSLDLSNFNTKKAKTMQYLFFNCSSLSSVNLSNFNTRNVNNMGYMFYNCLSMDSLNLSHFITNNLENMQYMFYNCKILSSLDISTFNTKKVKYMEYMFYNCSSFDFLNLSNIEMNNIADIKYLFYGSTKLEYLNLKLANVKISIPNTNIFELTPDNLLLCTNYEKWKIILPGVDQFINCIDDSYDSSLFKCYKKYYDQDFYNKYTCEICGSNFYIKEIDPDNNNSYINCYQKVEEEYYFDNDNLLFKPCYSSCKTCDKSGDNNNHNCIQCKDDYIYEIDKSVYKNCYDRCEFYSYYDKDINKLYCTNTMNCPEDYSKLILDKNECISECILDPIYKYEYNNKCYKECPTNTFIINNTYSCESINNEITETDSINKVKDFTSTPHDYPTTNIDSTQYNYHQNENSRSTNIKDNSLASIANDESTYKSTKSTNNYESTSNFHDSTSNLKDINQESISNSYGSINNNDLTQNSNGGNDNNDLTQWSYDSSKNNDISQNSDKDNNKDIIDNENITRKIINTSLYSEIILECSNDNLIVNICNFGNIKNNSDIYNIIKENLMDIYNENNIIIEGENGMKFQVTDAKKEKELLKNEGLNNYNLPIIDLGQCETKLREEYNLTDDIPLIFLKQESSINNVEYEVFDPYNQKKLNLSICNKNSINIYVPIKLNEKTKQKAEELKKKGYDIFNINDPFYQDICTPYKSEDGTDMLLSDRIDYIYNNDDIRCQPGCKFSNYILDTQYINCTCSVNENENFEEKKVEFKAKKFYQSFIDVLKYSNIDILKCYKLVFTINSITKNIGSIIVLITFIIYLICLIIYIIKGKIYIARRYESILKRIGKLYILYNYKNSKDLQIDTKMSMKENIIKTENDVNNPPKKKNKKNRMSSKTLITKYTKINKNEINPSKGQKLSVFESNGNNKKSNKSITILDKWNSNENKSSEEEISVDKKQKIDLDPYELNDLEYEEAVKYDQRSFIKIYWDTLKREHILLFTFINNKDYNFFVIKLAKLSFIITTDMAMNVLFFSDDSMHKIFLNYGKFDFVQQIVQIIYSTIVSQLLEVFLCFLSLTDVYFYKIKNLTPPDEIRKTFEYLKCMKKKLIIFFIFTFIFFGFYWYVVAVFCAVYENTQIIFLKDSLLSFVFSIVYSLILYFIPTCFRLCAIRNPKQNLQCIYKLSEIIPFF